MKATTDITDFNEMFGTNFAGEGFDTVGGLVITHFGRLPKRGESITLDDLRFTVVRADSRRLHSLLVERLIQRDVTRV